MKVFILSHDDLTSNLIFAPLFEAKGVDIQGIAFAASPSKAAASQLRGAVALRREMAAAYWGYLIFSNGFFRLFEWITSTLSLSPTFHPLVSLRALARGRKIPVQQCEDFNDPDFVNHLADLDLDYLLIRIGTILRKPILATPSKETWCVHSSLLPALGGIAGEFHGLRTGMPLGSTVFSVTPQLDRGPPLAQAAIPTQNGGSVFGHTLRNNLAAGQLLAAMFDQEFNRELRNSGLVASYFSWPQDDDLAELRGRRHRLIGWREAIRFVLSCLRLRRWQV